MHVVQSRGCFWQLNVNGRGVRARSQRKAVTCARVSVGIPGYKLIRSTLLSPRSEFNLARHACRLIQARSGRGRRMGRFRGCLRPPPSRSRGDHPGRQRNAWRAECWLANTWRAVCRGRHQRVPHNCPCTHSFRLVSMHGVVALCCVYAAGFGTSTAISMPWWMSSALTLPSQSGLAAASGLLMACR